MNPLKDFLFRLTLNKNFNIDKYNNLTIKLELLLITLEFMYSKIKYRTGIRKDNQWTKYHCIIRAKRLQEKTANGGFKESSHSLRCLSFKLRRRTIKIIVITSILWFLVDLIYIFRYQIFT